MSLSEGLLLAAEYAVCGSDVLGSHTLRVVQFGRHTLFAVAVACLLVPEELCGGLNLGQRTVNREATLSKLLMVSFMASVLKVLKASKLSQKNWGSKRVCVYGARVCMSAIVRVCAYMWTQLPVSGGITIHLSASTRV